MDVRVELDVATLYDNGEPCSDEDGGWIVGGGSEPPAESRIDGSSGGGPSIAHLFDSYLERMNDSILLRENLALDSAIVEKKSRTALGGCAPISDVLPSTDWPDDCPIS